MNLAIPSQPTASLQPSSFSLSQQQALTAVIMSMLAYCMQRMLSDMLQAANQPSNGLLPPNDTSPMPSPSLPQANPPCSTNSGGQHGSNTGNGNTGGNGRNGGNGSNPSGAGTGNGASPTTSGHSTTPTPTNGTPGPNGKQAPLPPGKVVTAPAGVQNKPIVVHKGEVFDGKNQTYIGGPCMGRGDQDEHQQPLFIVEDGGSLCNVHMKGGGDGVHFIGNGKMVNCVNEDVSEDAVTIDGQGNREHDAGIAGCSPEVSGRPKVEIINCTFKNAADKVVQDNGAADVVMSGDTVIGASKVFRTNGGHADIDSHLQVENCEFSRVKEAVFRTDAPGATVTLANLKTDAPEEVIAPDASQATGASRIGHKAYSG
ncbi:pectate lyase [Xanthomonas vesicatoria]|uniref:pectate lyase n=1 Tax=Xanthomonas vesicatoria TaxID=56460 RepID=UPI001E628FB9|nr:pectate lyase [Xanthomonas vesicatoria]MCC8617135.1 pectate lyase [Xanthomonas vesicatoria]MCC8631319.1 pectate lyase [Xanthomonas vesicatoria]